MNAVQTIAAKPALLIAVWGILMGASESIALSADKETDSAQPDTPVLFHTQSGRAEFTSSVPLHTFTGQSDHLTGMIDLQENVVDFYLDLSTLETGLRRRDRDMRRTLKVEQYPFAEFTGQLQGRFDPRVPESQPVTAVGEFTIHGVTKPLEIDGTLTPNGEGVQLEAGWTLLLEEYEIEPPGLLFYRVQQEQTIEIHAELMAVKKIPE